MAKFQTNSKGWKFIGGRLCLDFINTVGGRTNSGAVLNDKLSDYNDLLEWSRLAGSDNPAELRALARRAGSHRRDAFAALERALVLREVLYRIFKSVAAKHRPRKADLDSLDRELRAALGRRHLMHSAGEFDWNWESSDGALDRLLWPISLSAADLLTSSDLSRLRQCEGNNCGWIFLDTSRNRSRRWCDMQDCGNRAKVRRFRQRLERNQRAIRP